MKTVFIRAIEAPVDEKAAVIRGAVHGPSAARFKADIASFGQIPRSPFAYWTSDGIRACFTAHAQFESAGRTAKQGLATADDFRFVRLATEVPPPSRGVRWFSFAKGGAFSRFYADVYLVVDWSDAGARIKHNLNDAGKVRSNVWMLRDTAANFFFRPGLTWPLRTNGLSFRVMPDGCVFSHKGPAAFVDENDPQVLLALCAILNSGAFGALVAVQLARTELAQSFEVGLIQQTPVPSLGPEDTTGLADLALRSWSLKRRLDSRAETSHAFLLPGLLQVDADSLIDSAQSSGHVAAAVQSELDTLAIEINDHIYRLYGISAADRQRIEQGFGASSELDQGSDDDENGDSDEEADEVDVVPMVASLLSWSLGVAFGRFDVRLATGEREVPPEPEPFDPLPVCSPGMLTGDNGLPVAAPPADYPLPFPADGILVDDPGHPRDLVRAVRSVFDTVFEDADAHWGEAAEFLGASDLRTWFARDFFEPHIRRYSKSRRKAPIYWQIATASGSYSIWVYIHRATGDTLFRVLNDFVGPKLDHEKAKLDRLNQEAGPNASAAQRREIERQENFVGELSALKTEVARVAPLWKPNLDDGVILNFAPLWRLVSQSRSWQSECRKAWDKLQSGDYDWAHLAMHLWPERVVLECIDDRSLAIAHGLEDVFWHEDESGAWRKSQVDDATIRKLIGERTSTTVKAALKDLLSAPTAATGGKKKASRAVGAGKKAAPHAQESESRRQRGDRNALPAVDPDLLGKVKHAIANSSHGATKADVIEATGITDNEWNRAIVALLAGGSVTRTGERRGVRYQISGGIDV